MKTLKGIERKHKEWFAHLDGLLNERPWLRAQRILKEEEKLVIKFKVRLGD